MPAPIYFAHKILKVLSEKRRSRQLFDLQPDAKSQVTVQYVDGKPVGCTKVVVSTQHNAQTRNGKKYTPGMVKELIGDAVASALPKGWMPKKAVRLPGQSDRQLRRRRPGRRLRPDRPQDHRRHLWRLCAARRRRVLRQGPDQGRSLGRLCGALSRQERGRGRPRRAAAPSRSPMRSALPIRCRSMSTPTAPARSDEKKLAKSAAGDFPAAADQHPPRAQAQPADLSAHRGLRPFRPRAGQGRRLLLGAHRSRRRAQARAALIVHVMAGLVPAVHVFADPLNRDVDAPRQARLRLSHESGTASGPRLLRPAQRSQAAPAPRAADRDTAAAARDRSQRPGARRACARCFRCRSTTFSSRSASAAANI